MQTTVSVVPVNVTQVLRDVEQVSAISVKAKPVIATARRLRAAEHCAVLLVLVQEFAFFLLELIVDDDLKWERSTRELQSIATSNKMHY